jgi:chromosome segregation ATPase
VIADGPCGKLQDRITELEQLVYQRSAERNRLEEQVGELERERGEMNQALADELKTIDELRDTVRVLADKNAALQAELAQLKKDAVACAEACLDAIEHQAQELGARHG